MEIKSKKPRGGSCCAVATCTLYSGKTKQVGRDDVYFHRFPKDVDKKKVWMKLCKRADKWNPDTSFICSDHFSPTQFERNLQAELLGYISKCKKLKSDAVPSLNLLPLVNNQSHSESTINRRERFELKKTNEIHKTLIQTIVDDNTDDQSQIHNTNLVSDVNEDENYRQLYEELLVKYERLKDSQATQFNVNYQQINENLRHEVKIIKSQLSETSTSLKKVQKEMSNEIKVLTKQNKNTIENEVKHLLSSVFSENQIKLLLKKQKRVCWSKEEIANAFSLRYYSKRAYQYVKNEMHYPLPEP